jgi:hydrogenase maturation protein HypF
MREGRRIEVRGTVQGVGFRPHVYRLAETLGIAGRVSNHSAGVTIEAFATARALDEFIALVAASPPPAEVAAIDWQPIVVDSTDGAFTIAPSTNESERRISIPADLATCAACEREIFDPSNRRFRYPFTNCTHCGPRFTIARDVPYDRPATTMAPFHMCADCRSEYDDPRDRRFHAQPNACWTCGPCLHMLAPDGRPVAGDPLIAAARMLADGGIVALKGLGGFHLACDATSAAAVERLRARKRRDWKPFADRARHRRRPSAYR